MKRLTNLDRELTCLEKLLVGSSGRRDVRQTNPFEDPDVEMMPKAIGVGFRLYKTLYPVLISFILVRKISRWGWDHV